MTTWTTLADATLAQDKPLTQSVARALRDNPTAIAEGSSGSPVIVGLNPLIVSAASSSSTLTFTSLPALDLIEFELFNLRPVTNGAVLRAQVSINNGSSFISSYAFAKTISEISTGGSPSGANEGGYAAAQMDLSQASGGVANGSNSGVSGIFKLLSPGSSSLLKMAQWHVNHSNGSTSGFDNVTGSAAIAGVTTAQQINAIKFYFSTGNISAGSIAVRPRRATATN